MSTFTIHATHRGAEGVGATVNRAFPTAGRDHVDPFVLLDHFAVGEGGVPEHVHRGFEIVTYMLEGGLAHTDGTGVSKTATAGGAMRMRCGSGLRHAEHPATDDPARGLQLWINLPREDKEVEPDYRDADPGELPVDVRDGLAVTTVVGEDSPLDLRADVRYRVVEADAGSTYEWPVEAGWSALCYVIEGAVTIPDGTIESREVAVRDGRKRRSATDDATIPVEATEDATYALVAGHPLDQPITQRGPIVR